MKTLTIDLLPKCLTVQPVPRADLAAFIKHMAIIQSIWIEEGFSTADAIARDDCWNEMLAVAKMLPKHDTPAIRGFPLDALSNDYEQLEKLFFGNAKSAYDPDFLDIDVAIAAGFNMSLFEGCQLYELHRFESKKKLVEANRLRLERLQKEPSKPKTSPSKAQGTKTQTRSQTSSTALAQQTA